MDHDDRDDRVPINVKVKVGGATLTAEGEVPAEANRLRDFLPVLQSLDGQLVRRAARRVESDGDQISCCAGCGACCRQLVPVSHAEALVLSDLVDAMGWWESLLADVLRREAEGLLERSQRD